MKEYVVEWEYRGEWFRASLKANDEEEARRATMLLALGDFERELEIYVKPVQK